MIISKTLLNRESLPICTLRNIILFLQDLLQLHCVSTHYSFQIMKCVGEDGFSFLPCPVPDDSGDHFKSSQEVYKFFDNGLF